MTDKKPTKKPVKKVSNANKKWVAVVGLNIDGSTFEPGDVVTKKVPDWMIDQNKVIEDK